MSKRDRQQWLLSLNLQNPPVLPLSPLHFLVLMEKVMLHEGEVIVQNFPECTLSLRGYELDVGVVKINPQNYTVSAYFLTPACSS